MVATAERSQRNEPGLQPHVFERPLLKFGATLVQLPWIVGLQNNSSAAINNLRRIGARPGQARGEAQRIEAGLAQLFETLGFKTLLNWEPLRAMDDPGEVDLSATLDGHLFVIEVKSMFMRRSQRDVIWCSGTRPASSPAPRPVQAPGSRATQAGTPPSPLPGASGRRPTSTSASTAWCWTACTGAVPTACRASSRWVRPTTTSCTPRCGPSSPGCRSCSPAGECWSRRWARPGWPKPDADADEACTLRPLRAPAATCDIVFGPRAARSVHMAALRIGAGLAAAALAGSV